MLVAVLVIAGRRRSEARDERLRVEAQEHRDLAQVSDLEAQRQKAAAEEQAARAKQDAIEAEQARLDAERQAGEAAELRAKADHLDPDVDVEDRAELHDGEAADETVARRR